MSEKKLTLQERIDAADAAAEDYAEKMKAPDIDVDEFCGLVRRVVLEKFLLTDEEAAQTDELLKLADISVEKLLWLHDKSVELGHASMNCTGLSSTATKKVLLILKLQRDLGLEPMSADVSVKLTTTRELGESLFMRLREARMS